MSGSSGGRTVTVRSDQVLRQGNAIIQHGPHNNRVYVMKVDPADPGFAIRFADELCEREGYSKVFAKVPASCAGLFREHGYVTEATVPFFFRGTGTAEFMAKYRDPGRREVPQLSTIRNIIAEAKASAPDHLRQPVVPEGFVLSCASPEDAEDIADLYRLVFETYPFPITDPAYIRETMESHIRYFVIKKAHTIAAVASCEIDSGNLNVEVTDFATNPLFRGRGFAGILLREMEQEMKKEGIILSYTIARALFRPINTVFGGAGYEYAGLLPNNTNICGSFESMNVWYRKL
jgi:putative beta-lysine N-acetyltransferase